jgi:hypothetical protein
MVRYGLRRQSAAATALSPAQKLSESAKAFIRSKSGVALRFPPQSKTPQIYHSRSASNAARTSQFVNP